MNNQNQYPYGQQSPNQGYPYGQSVNNANYPYGQPMNNQGYYNQPQGMMPGQQVVYPNQYSQVPNNPSPPKKSKKKIVIAILILLVAIAVVCFFLFGNKKNGVKENKKGRETTINRTVMIYMVGSDLENYGSASAELNHIRPNNIDLENNNIILLAGGSKVWENDYIDFNETSTYQLKESGFEKVNQESLKNMGEAKTLSDFLNYVYNTYPSKQYDLIFWNHGAGIDGVAYDDISEDLLTFSELKEALENSSFKEEKMETVLFMNSLLGSIELAGVVDDYANYMIASEELSYSHPFIDKFKFLEELETNDDGLTFGKKFVDNLSVNNYLKSNLKYYNTPITYSVIDLSKVSQLEKDLNLFIEKLNVQNSYEQIALVRSKTFQYGGENSNYDMVDLYTLISNLESLASTEAKTLMDDISSAVVHNYASDESSKGLSIYFPYNNTRNTVATSIESLESLRTNNSYLTFIEEFDSYRRSKSSGMDLSSNEVSASPGNYSMQLSPEQKENLVSASYIIVKESINGTATPIYFSDNTSIDATGKLVANFDGKILTALDTTSNQMYPIVTYEKAGNLMTTIQLQKTDKSVIIDANAYIDIKNDEGKIGIAIQKDSTPKFVELPTMSILTLENYQNLIFTNHDYRITGSNGEVSKNWQSAGNDHNVNALVNHYRIQKQEMNLNDRYYFAFKVTDISNEVSYSKLVEIK